MLLLSCGDDGGGSASQAIASRLRECELVTDGQVNPYVGDSEAAECQGRCNASATCEELARLYCRGRASDRLSDCYAECFAPKECPDGSGRYTLLAICDGVKDCVDGTDERACPDAREWPEYCEKSGARIFPFQRCNGIDDCGDLTDEQGCPESGPTFTCENGRAGFSREIPRTHVCDLFTDCSDRSDESVEQGCARLTCSSSR
jgi:hypothetical protein